MVQGNTRQALYIYIYKGASPGGRVNAAVEANARKKRKTTAKGRLRCQGLLANIPINPGRLEKLILTTDCVYDRILLIVGEI